MGRPAGPFDTICDSRTRLFAWIGTLVLSSISPLHAQKIADTYSNPSIVSAIVDVQKSIGSLPKNSDALDSIRLLLEFNPSGRHRFILPSKPTTAKLNAEQLAKQFPNGDSFEKFRKAIDQLASVIEDAALASESKQDLESGYRLRWQAAGLRSIAPSGSIRKELSKQLWTHSSAIGSMQLTRKVFVNHPKNIFAAGTYSLVTTPNFEIASQAGTRSTEEVAELCEQAFAVWKQLFFSYWTSEQTSAPEYSRASDSSKFSVVLFENLGSYKKALQSTERNIGISTGYYEPNRKIALFYWDGQKTAATVVHEMAHQLFFEASPRNVNLDTDNEPGFWIVEGVALYLESMSARACGGARIIDIGGWDSPRFQAGRYRRLHDQYWIQWDDFRSATGTQFRRGSDIEKRYSQACGLSHLWLDGTPDQQTAIARYIQSVYAGKEDASLLGEENEESKLLQAYDRMLLSGFSPATSRPYFSIRKDAIMSRCSITSQQLLNWPTPYRSSSWIDLSFTNVDDALFTTGESPVSPPWNVARLNLESTRITDRSLSVLSQMKDLENLDLSNCKVSDAGIEALRENKSLKTLWLTQCNISDQSIDVFLTISQLSSIHLTGTKISREGWERLLRERPRLKSNSEGPMPTGK